MKSPDQALYDYVFTQSTLKGYTTYDHLPMSSENAPYPFVIVDTVQTAPIATKTGYGAQLSIMVHVWASGDDRITASTMTSDLLQILGFCDFETSGYAFAPRNQQSQMMQDTSVPDTVLWHGVDTLVFDLK